MPHPDFSNLTDAQVVYSNTGAFAEAQRTRNYARTPEQVRTFHRLDAQVRAPLWREIERRNLRSLYHSLAGHRDEHLFSVEARTAFAQQHNLPVWAPETQPTNPQR